MPVSRLDTVYRKMLLTKFFTKGWGNPEHLLKLFTFRKLVSNRETCYHLVSKNHPITILNEQTWKKYKIIEGKFLSPLALHMPEVVPEEVQYAYFQMIVPVEWKSEHKSICIHLAGTGDHFFWRRRNLMAKPLLLKNIGAIILENPFYGLRKPKNQIRSSLHNVSDIFVMGGCLILECLVLLHWCQRLGYGPLGVSGLSMGGHMASLAATNWPEPLVLVPCLSWSTASSVFTEGVMSESIDWNLLQTQYQENHLYNDKLSNLVSIVDKPVCAKHNLVDSVLYNDYSFNVDHHLLISGTEYDVNKVNKLSKITGMLNMPTLSSFVNSNDSNKIHKVANKKYAQAVHFMRGIMDECTHLKNFSVPFDTSLTIVVCAQADGYVPREGCSSLEDIWPGVTVRYVNAGHVSAYIWYRHFFRNCIEKAFEKAKLKLG